MINGFVGFQLYEDGTTLSVWLLRVCSVVMFLISFAVSLLTFKNWGGLGPTNTIGLFVVVYIFSAIFIFVYVVMQILLIVGTLQERWPLWHIGFGIFALVIGQVILYVFSEVICDNVQHYLDGLFFATLLNLLAVMMVYKVCTDNSPLAGMLTDTMHSIGTRSQEKISNSPLVQDKATGRSSNSCPRTIYTTLHTGTTATMRQACITSLQGASLRTAATKCLEYSDAPRF